MKKILSLFLFFILFACSEVDIAEREPLEYGEQDYVTDASGVQYPGLDPPSYQYCGPGWGRKFCRFLGKYDGTIWADAENSDSGFSEIKFSNDVYFISFCTLDNAVSNCEGWKLGETTHDGIKWNIKIKKDQVDVLWFTYQYYGSNEEREYTITHKYEVIDGLLHYSSTEGKTFIFNPSEKNYSE